MKQKKIFLSGLTLLIILMSFQFYFTGCNKIKDIVNSDDNDKLGDTLWVHYLPKANKTHYIDVNPLAIGQNGTIYYTAGGGMNNYDPIRVYAVNKSDGSLKWESEPLQSWHTNSNIVIGDDGSVYISSGTILYSLNQADGSFNWTWEVPQSLDNRYTYGELGPLALAANGNLITKTTGGGSYYRALYCISINGNIKWFRFIGSKNSPISINKEGIIFDFEYDNNGSMLTATNPNDGSLLWTFPAVLSSDYNNIIITDDDNIITLIHPDTLIKINSTNHQILWKSETKTYQDYKYMDAQGNIILYDQFTGSYIYNSTNGNLIKTESKLPHLISIDSKNHIYGVISDRDPYLSVTDEDGNIIWENPCKIYSATTAISDANIVYVANSTEILALKTNAKLAHSGWPRFTHDNRNTCNSAKW